MSVVCFQPNDAPVEGAGNSRGAHVTQATPCWHYSHAGSSWESSPGYPTPQQRGVRHSEHPFDNHPLISWAGSVVEIPGLRFADQVKGYIRRFRLCISHHSPEPCSNTKNIGRKPTAKGASCNWNQQWWLMQNTCFLSCQDPGVGNTNFYHILNRGMSKQNCFRSMVI